MATSNRDRIGQMLDILAPALKAFLAATLEPHLSPGQSWVSLVAARDLKKGIAGKDYSADDPQVQLRVLTENVPHQVKPGWYPFDGVLSRVHQSYASELRDVRNDWAHHKSFSDDDAYRALDTAERLLLAIGAPAQADGVSRIRTNLRRVSAEKDDKRTLRQAVPDSPLSAGLRPWREVLPPHADVASGNFKASEFAADLYKVANGDDAGRDYADPVEFFRRTYLTEGLRDLIGRAADRLAGDDNASPVINLQTNFGGGKTHSMLSLWHLAGGTALSDYPQEVQDLLSPRGFDQLTAPVNRVAIVGNHFAPTGESKPDGTFVRTIWGELAWQLGGADGYAMVAEADATSTPPGRALHDLLAAYSPAVILIDEWVAYARSLYGVGASSGAEDTRVTGGSFDNQFGFAQSLTEAAKGTSGVVLAISIPASETGVSDSAEREGGGNLEEVGGSHGMEALARLQNVVRRVAEPWRPASAAEAYHIVRQRLFTTPDAEALAAIKATARAMGDLYRKNATDFPMESRDPAYEDRIRQTYPIHPELFDRLYEDWSSLERFQRTRGVLRLMNAVVHALWVGEDSGPLILPGSMPLATADVNTEIAQYLPDSWKAVIDADVDGPQSEPVKIDQARPQLGGRSLTRRLARTIFFGAVPTIGSAHKGIETPRVFLGTAVPGDRTGDFHAALNALADRATYYYSGQGKHWYDLQANITRSAKDQAERLHREDVWAEIVRRLGEQARTRGPFAGVHVCPESDADVPDLDQARLVILHPKAAHKSQRGAVAESAAVDAVRTTLERRGTAHRTFRNMLVFAVADQNRLEELESAVRDYLGWSHVLASSDLDLTQNQSAQAGDRRRRADEAVEARLLQTYQWALHPRQGDAQQPWTLVETKVDAQLPAIAERVAKRMTSDGDLAAVHAMSSVRMALDKVPGIWRHGHISVKDLWGLYGTYPYMPRLTDRDVLIAGLTHRHTLPETWERDGFALAQGYDDAQGRYAGLWLPGEDATPHVTEQTLLVTPARATEQRRAESAEAPPREAESESSEPAFATGPGRAAGAHTPASAALAPGHGVRADSALESELRRYFASAQLSEQRYTLDFKQIADEVLAHLATPGTRLRVRVEIEAEAPDGFSEALIRTVRENAAVLKFDESSFEEE